jgi:hypothetical protein
MASHASAAKLARRNQPIEIDDEFNPADRLAQSK